jgi:hypothetical protein
MSMDLEVWTEPSPQLPDWLPEPARWSRGTDEWAYEGDGWHVLVLPEASDDAPIEVASRLAAAHYRICVTLEPIGAPAAGYEMLEAVVRGIAERSGGLWLDPRGEAFAFDEGEF